MILPDCWSKVADFWLLGWEESLRFVAKNRLKRNSWKVVRSDWVRSENGKKNWIWFRHSNYRMKVVSAWEKRCSSTLNQIRPNSSHRSSHSSAEPTRPIDDAFFGWGDSTVWDFSSRPIARWKLSVVRRKKNLRWFSIRHKNRADKKFLVLRRQIFSFDRPTKNPAKKIDRRKFDATSIRVDPEKTTNNRTNFVRSIWKNFGKTVRR